MFITKDRGLQLRQGIVERKRTEEELRSSERRFLAVIESANDTIISSNENGNITFWNRGAQAIFGYKEKEVLGRPLTILMPERYRDGHKKGMERLNATGKTRVVGKTMELHGLRKDGNEFPLELSISTWKMGKESFYAAIIREITNHKLAKEALQKARDELEIRVKARTAELTTANKTLKREITKRSRAEEALRENEGRFHQIFEQNEDAVFAVLTIFVKIKFHPFTTLIPL